VKLQIASLPVISAMRRPSHFDIGRDNFVDLMIKKFRGQGRSGHEIFQACQGASGRGSYVNIGDVRLCQGASGGEVMFNTRKR
jgi:hypothetical protein